MKTISWWLLLACALWSQAANAKWYQAQGQAMIVDNNQAQAHELAVRDAVKQALLYAGAAVSSLQQLETGVVTRDLLQVRSQGEIRGVQVLEQQIHDELLTVSINVDIVADPNKCLDSRYAKSVIVTRFELRDREQAVNGGLFQLGSAISERLHRELSRQHSRFVTRHWLDINLPYTTNSQDANDNNAALIQGIAKRNDSQYVVVGRINDISVNAPAGRLSLLRWFKPVPRVFGSDLWLFDGISGEPIGHWNYQVSASWEFGNTDKVDLSARRFWQSQYGRALTQVIEQMQMDLEQALECEPLRGWVIKTERPRLQINLGSRNGIAVGDPFTVWHNSAYFDQDGHARQQWRETGSRFRISALFPNHALLEPVDEYPYVSVQLHDFVRPLAPPEAAQAKP